MSLIEQALRKVQDPVLRAAQAKTTEAPPTARTEAPPSPAHSWPTRPATAPRPSQLTESPNALVVVASAIVSLVVVLLVAGGVWLGQTLRKGSTPITAAPTPEEPAALQEGVLPAEKPKVSSAGAVSVPNPLFLTDVARISRGPATHPANASKPVSFILSGIVQGSGEPYALINDAIVGVGETIEGYTLLEIGNGRARLRGRDGDETVLRVPR